MRLSTRSRTGGAYSSWGRPGDAPGAQHRRRAMPNPGPQAVLHSMTAGGNRTPYVYLLYLYALQLCLWGPRPPMGLSSSTPQQSQRPVKGSLAVIDIYVKKIPGNR